jgi:hypothetical protein
MDAMDAREHKFFIAILGRQSGKSYLDKRICLEYSNNQGMRGMWISPSYTSARNHWQDLLNMIETSGLPVKSINRQSYEIHFHGGGFLGVRTALEPNNIRGDSLNYAIMDEAAFYRNGKYVWEQVVMPMLTTSRGIMLMTTTPNGRNWVYDMYQEGLKKKSKLYKSWHMTSLDSPIQDKEVLLEIKKTMTEKAWRAEFMAEFLVDGGGVFAGVQEAATVAPLREPEVGHSYVAGVDVGGTEDSTTFTVIDKYTRKQVYGKDFENIGTIKTVVNIIKLLDHWQPEITHLEKNGVGTHLGKLLKEALRGSLDEQALQRLLDSTDEFTDDTLTEYEGRHRVRLVWMDNALKREAVERVAVDIEYGRLALLTETCPYGKKQLSEMSTFEAKRTRSQLAVTYSAAEGYHDDTVSGLYLAYMGVPKPVPFKKHWEKAKSTKSPFKRNSNTPRKHRTGGKRLR